MTSDKKVLSTSNTQLIEEQQKLLELLHNNSSKEVLEVISLIEDIFERSSYTYHIVQPTCGTNAN